MNNNTPIVWNPKDGVACQGDVVLMAIPSDLKINKLHEIHPKDGRLIVAEGEVTGHHHAFWNPQPAMFRDDGLARDMMATTTPAPKKNEVINSVRLYRDEAAVNELVSRGKLTSNRLAIGFLEVVGESFTLTHDEHDPITIPPGMYYAGGQREFDAAEERRVRD